MLAQVFGFCAFVSVLPVVAQQPTNIATAQWQYTREDDPLHAKVHDRFILDGVYLTPPSISAGAAPAIVVVCSAGKVEQSYFNIGAVVDHRGPSGSSGLEVVGFEARVDGKKHGMFPNNMSTDGRAVYFIRGDLKSFLGAKQVIIGANEYLGPQIVMRFDIPDPFPVMEKCGSDWVLKPRGRK
jgi:hypothetical protein